MKYGRNNQNKNQKRNQKQNQKENQEFNQKINQKNYQKNQKRNQNENQTSSDPKSNITNGQNALHNRRVTVSRSPLQPPPKRLPPCPIPLTPTFHPFSSSCRVCTVFVSCLSYACAPPLVVLIVSSCRVYAYTGRETDR